MKRDKVKKIAVAMIKEKGLINLSRKELCQRANIPDGSFPHIMECNFSDFVKELRNMNIVTAPITTVSKRRVSAEMRKEHILSVAVNLAKNKCYSRITRDSVAEQAGVSMALVSKYFGTMGQLKNDIVRYAIKNEIVEIIAQCVANKHPKVKKLSLKLKTKAIEFLTA